MIGAMALVMGLDGCRFGWVAVTTSADGRGLSSVSVIPDLAMVIERLDSGDLAAATIDIPIGLSDTWPRPVDVEARKLVGLRASSVFPTPLRAVLGSPDYQSACERSFALCGKRMSKQAFAITPKIEEVDKAMTPERQNRLVEIHPEVSFTVLAGRPMSFPKRTSEGRAERLAVLRSEFEDLGDHVSVRVPGTAPDDVVDAFVAAWTARRWANGAHVQLGGDLDSRGLRMEMIA